MYIYPDNLKAKATLWLWELRDVAVIGAGFILAAFALVKLAWAMPLVTTAAFAFLTIRVGGSSVLDFLRNAAGYFFINPQTYEWSERNVN
jgi:hypothetical protein